MNTQHIVIRPILTEKSMREAGMGKCTFEVLRSADKNIIKKAVQEKFSVNVVGVTTTIVKGGSKRVGKRFAEVKKSPWKKATVTLKKGQKIDIFDSSQG